MHIIFRTSMLFYYIYLKMTNSIGPVAVLYLGHVQQFGPCNTFAK